MRTSNDQTLWDLLGVAPGSSQFVVDKAYKKLRNIGKTRNIKNLQFAWKLLRDPFFSVAYLKYGFIKSVIEAGFFNNGLEPEEDYEEVKNPFWLTTPFHKIIKNFGNLDRKEKSKPFVVLLSTGAFAPIHPGHIQMMEIAKTEIEKKGKIVLGGYISPSHDGYLSAKRPETVSFPVEDRIYLCQKALSESNWLMVDTWEARYNKAPITFSEVIMRTEKYLSTHIKIEKQIEIVYVFGSDNATFSRAFIGMGSCICVKRSGYEDKMMEIMQDNLIAKNKNIILTKYKVVSKISSSDLRKLNETNQSSNIKNENVKKYYVLRNDGDWAIGKWFLSRNPEEVSESKEKFLHSLVASFRNIFREDLVFTLDLKKQQLVLDSLNKKKPVINLDVCTKSLYKINISRSFALSDSQFHLESLMKRPGYPSLKNQFEKIPAGDYTLVDDDTASGATVNGLLNVFPKRIVINKIETLLFHGLVKSGRGIIDVVDLRDFIVGSRDGGLVSVLPNGKISRMPYMFPYVSLTTRGKIPPSKVMKLSIELWKLNADFYKKIHKPILLKETDFYFQNLMTYIGFSKGTSIYDISQWHIHQLLKSTNYKLN